MAEKSDRTHSVPAEERILLPRGEEYLQLQKDVDKLQRVQWIQTLADWQIMATGTFRWEASCMSAAKCFERWMAKKYCGVSYFYSIEAHPGGHGYHVHSLWADCRSVYRKEGWADWCKRFGWNQINPVRSKEDSASYAAKYLTKPAGWWNVKLQWHRLQAINNRNFVLRASEAM